MDASDVIWRCEPPSSTARRWTPSAVVSRRFASPEVRWFEVDHPATQADKRARLSAVGAPAGQTAFVAVDLVHDDVVPALRAAGHDPTRPSLFVVEGLLGYLPRTVTSDLLGSLRELAGRGSRMAVAFPTVSHDAPAQERLRRRFRGLLVAALGEPWLTRFGPHEPEQLLAQAGWAVAVNGEQPVRYQGRNGVLVGARLGGTGPLGQRRGRRRETLASVTTETEPMIMGIQPGTSDALRPRERPSRPPH
jgi:hypothetical protein